MQYPTDSSYRDAGSSFRV